MGRGEQFEQVGAGDRGREGWIWTIFLLVAVVARKEVG